MTFQTKTRGYLLIDIMIGGALAAIVIAGVLTVLANARTRNVAATRDIIAAQLVLEKLDQVRSFGFSGVAGQAGNEAAVPNVVGKYRRVTAVSAIANETITSGTSTSTIRFRDVTVTVTFESNASLAVRSDSGANRTTRTSTASTRVYE